MQSYFQQHALLARKYNPDIGTICLCGNATRTVCCKDCFGRNATCTECFISSHSTMPTHWAQVWDSKHGFFVRRDISLLREGGFAIPLGHGGQRCPRRSDHESGKENQVIFHLINSNGVHNTLIQFCTCHGTPDRVRQLLNFGFFPATPKRPTMAFSFALLHQFHIHH